jgi:hypothetical protein
MANHTAETPLVTISPAVAIGHELTADENGRLQCPCKNYVAQDFVAHGRPVCAHTVAHEIEVEIAVYLAAKGESLNAVVNLGQFISSRLSAVA